MTATAEFWWYFPALLTDSKSVKPIPPVTCSGDNCTSFFVPGTMRTILLDPSLPPLSSANFTDAFSYIQNDAPGYQVEFTSTDPDESSFDLGHDCRVFGIDILGMQICLKKERDFLIAGASYKSKTNKGWSACPMSVAIESGCLNTTDWRTDIPFTTKMAISLRRASTVFHRFNFTIMDITDLSEPTPIVYDPEVFFSFYNIISGSMRTNRAGLLVRNISF